MTVTIFLALFIIISTNYITRKRYIDSALSEWDFDTSDYERYIEHEIGEKILGDLDKQRKEVAERNRRLKLTLEEKEKKPKRGEKTKRKIKGKSVTEVHQQNDMVPRLVRG